ncbi:hypothetical protein AKO1_008956 [Acrasis kona]|uniref:Uncharacterized protein n=1 Tax=Acrasis kona TaxID=1008807 RepID=A0AAW2ZH64_9EUKA
MLTTNGTIADPHNRVNSDIVYEKNEVILGGEHHDPRTPNVSSEDQRHTAVEDDAQKPLERQTSVNKLRHSFVPIMGANVMREMMNKNILKSSHTNEEIKEVVGEDAVTTLVEPEPKVEEPVELSVKKTYLPTATPPNSACTLSPEPNSATESVPFETLIQPFTPPVEPIVQAENLPAETTSTIAQPVQADNLPAETTNTIAQPVQVETTKSVVETVVKPVPQAEQTVAAVEVTPAPVPVALVQQSQMPVETIVTTVTVPVTTPAPAEPVEVKPIERKTSITQNKNFLNELNNRLSIKPQSAAEKRLSAELREAVATPDHVREEREEHIRDMERESERRKLEMMAREREIEQTPSPNAPSSTLANIQQIQSEPLDPILVDPVHNVHKLPSPVVAVPKKKRTPKTPISPLNKKKKKTAWGKLKGLFKKKEKARNLPSPKKDFEIDETIVSTTHV